MKRKHTCKTENNPEKCDVCEEKFLRYSGEPWEKEMIESHILSHAYKGEHELKFKCDECEFWGPNKLTMEVHVRKVHCENISCRLCDFKASSKNELETHLSTCERYACCMCQKTFHTVINIKEHIKEEHEERNTRIIHAKSSRTYPDFFDEKSYFSKELFNNK